MISRTLKPPKQNYATNERKLLYGSREINIFTDHQPLTLAVADRNTNAKIKRWKSYIDQHNANVFCKPGKEILWQMPYPGRI